MNSSKALVKTIRLKRHLIYQCVVDRSSDLFLSLTLFSISSNDDFDEMDSPIEFTIAICSSISSIFESNIVSLTFDSFRSLVTSISISSSIFHLFSWTFLRLVCKLTKEGLQFQLQFLSVLNDFYNIFHIMCFMILQHAKLADWPVTSNIITIQSFHLLCRSQVSNSSMEHKLSFIGLRIYLFCGKAGGSLLSFMLPFVLRTHKFTVTN